MAHEEDEEIVDDSEPEVIYSELHEPPTTPEIPRSSPEQPSLVRCRLLMVQDERNLHHSNSCSNLPQLAPPSAPLSRSANCVQDDVNEEPTYLPMAACRPDRKRINSESAAFRSALLLPGLAVGLSSARDAASSAENIYVTMTNDRKQSLTSEIYALVAGVETTSSGP